MYQIEIRKASANGFMTPAEARRYYGKYARDGVTYHWWNSPDKIADSAHDNIVNYFLSNASRSAAPTINYVLSQKKITYVTNPDYVTWHATKGNPTTIGVECSPHFNNEWYKKAGWLHSELESRYGKPLKIYVHKDWQSTQCSPIDKARIRQEADRWKTGYYDPKPTPPPAKPVVDNWVLWKEQPVEYVTKNQPTHMWNFNSKDWNMEKVKTFNKGDRITIVGSAWNTVLNREYYLTQYSFTRKITNGFNPVDLEVYVPPRPPVVEPPIDPEPPLDPPVEPPVEPSVPISVLESFWAAVTKLWNEMLNKFRKS